MKQDRSWRRKVCNGCLWLPGQPALVYILRRVNNPGVCLPIHSLTLSLLKLFKRYSSSQLLKASALHRKKVRMLLTSLTLCHFFGFTLYISFVTIEQLIIKTPNTVRLPLNRELFQYIDLISSNLNFIYTTVFYYCNELYY